MNKWWMRYYKMDEANDGTDGGGGGGAGSAGDGNDGDSGNDGSGDAGDGNDGDAGDGNDGDAGSKEGADDKKPKVTDAEAKLLKENLKKKEALLKANEELAKTKERLKAFEGIDPEMVKKLIAEKNDAETKALEAKGDWERLKQRMVDEQAKVVEGMQTQIADLSKQLGEKVNQINELTIGTQFSNSPFIKEKMLMTPAKAKVVYSQHFELENGTLVGYDKPKGAENRTPFVDASGAALGFDAVMEKLVNSDPEREFLLKPTMKPGANSGSESFDKSKVDGKPETTSINKIADGLKGLKSS